MSTGAIVAIAVVAVIVVLVVGILIPRMRERGRIRKRERELQHRVAKRLGIGAAQCGIEPVAAADSLALAGEHDELLGGGHHLFREIADTKAQSAEEAEQRARIAEQEARRERAEAELHKERAEATESGRADEELLAERERESAPRN